MSLSHHLSSRGFVLETSIRTDSMISSRTSIVVITYFIYLLIIRTIYIIVIHAINTMNST